MPITEVLTTVVITPIIKSLVEKLMQSKYLKDIIEDTSESLNFKKQLENYLTRKYENYSKLKTILHQQDVDLNKIFYPLNLIESPMLYGKNKNKEYVSVNNIEGIFKKSNFVSIIGIAGSGKSTLTKYIFLKSIADIAEKMTIPVYIELRRLQEKKDVLEYIKEELKFENLYISEGLLKKALEKGIFTIFLDGFDEVKQHNKGGVLNYIQRLADRHPKNKFILTSRPNSGVESLRNFYLYKISELNKNDIEPFIRNQLKDFEEEERIIQVKQKIEDYKFEFAKGYIKNPLLLSLYIKLAISESLLPTNRAGFYEKVFNTLTEDHDKVSKAGYEREILSGLSLIKIKEIISILSFMTYKDQRVEFDNDYLIKQLNSIKELDAFSFDPNLLKEDLLKTICILVKDGDSVSFIHKSIQEFFTAKFLLNKKDIVKRKENYETLIRDYYENENLIQICYELDEYNFNDIFFSSLDDFLNELDISISSYTNNADDNESQQLAKKDTLPFKNIFNFRIRFFKEDPAVSKKSRFRTIDLELAFVNKVNKNDFLKLILENKDKLKVTIQLTSKPDLERLDRIHKILLQNNLDINKESLVLNDEATLQLVKYSFKDIKSHDFDKYFLNSEIDVTNLPGFKSFDSINDFVYLIIKRIRKDVIKLKDKIDESLADEEQKNYLNF
jgi:hypothetical protein